MNFCLFTDISLHNATIGKENLSKLFSDISVPTYFEANKSNDWLLWLGDFVLPEKNINQKAWLKNLLQNFNIEKLLQTGGNYYCIYFNSIRNELNIFTGFLNIMPIYTFIEKDKVIVSSDPKDIVKHANSNFGINKSFILEKILFNYPFKNDTIYSGIKMISGNHYLQINRTGINEIRHTEMLDWIVENPVPPKKALHQLTGVLNERIDAYLPDDEFYLSFTGGFDGRTILSRAIAKRSKSVCYSFGTKSSQDLIIPMNQAKQLNLEFQPFYLDDDEYVKKSKQYGLELVDLTASMSNFSRAHYVYAAKKISKTTKFIVTGNFGSELFRAFHNTGVMVTPFLYHLLTTSNIDQFLDNYSFQELSLINKDFFKDELIGLKDSIVKQELFTNKIFTKNQVFYKYVFEDIFRKYFGAELIMQQKYLTNRTPFIDYMLVKELLKTELAGVYSKFYEQNPMKRLKGQMLYANCIKSNSTQLYNMMTGKGYPPKSVVSNFGKLHLMWNLVDKKINKRRNPSDEFGVNKAFKFNLKDYKTLNINNQYFNSENINLALDESEKNLNGLINTISLNWYIDKHF